MSTVTYYLTIWRSGVEGSCFFLWCFLDFAVEFRGGGLVELDAVLQMTGSNCI